MRLMPKVDSNGVSIHYEVFGEGKPIVLVHGFASSQQHNWVSTGWIDTLTTVRQVVALDCRGHGQSGTPQGAGAYAPDAMCDDVIAVMDHLDIARADLFGYSMGAGIALRLLVAHPERFATAIVGGVGERNNEELQALDGLRGAAERPAGEGVELASLTHPVLIVNGEDDRAVGDPGSVASRIPKARLMTIAGCDHMTVVPDQRFKDAVLDFLAQ